MKHHLALVAITLSATTFSSHAEEVWYGLNIHGSSCVEISPPKGSRLAYLNGARTPRELYDRLKERASDAKLQPFIEVIRAEQKPNKPADPKEVEFLQNFSESNAYLISSKSLGVELPIVESAVCQRLKLPITREK